jgi:tetratricopeptide (TPR) repeat protein
LSLFAKQKKPILLLLEDLQWLGESLDVLREMNQYIDRLPLMVIGSFRDDERPDLPQSLPNMQTFKLHRLSYDEIEQLSESMLGKVGKQPEIVSLLQRETEGNVFFVVEVLRTLAKEAGKLENIADMTLPNRVVAGGIQMILQHQLDQVTVDEYEILKLAAIYGRFINLEIMDQLLDHYDVSRDIWLRNCANVNIIELYDGSWRFTHDRLREHLLEQLDEQTIQDLSQEVAQVVESLHADDTNWSEILMSLWRDAGEIDKELHYMSHLIRQNRQYSFDYDRVKSYAHYALDYLPDDDVRRVDFLNPLSQVNWREGDYQDGHKHATLANELAKAHDYTIGLADSYNNLGNTAYYLGHYESAIIYYRHCADIYHAMDNQFDWALNLQNIGWTYIYVADYESAWDFVEQGQAIFIEMDNYWGIANGYYIMALIASHEGKPDEALEFHQKSLYIAREQEDIWSVILNLNNLGFVYLELDDMDNAQTTFQDAIKTTYESRLYGGMLEALVGVAHLYVRDNNPQQAGLLIGAIEAHPAINSDVHFRLDKLRQIIGTSLPSDELEHAIQQGKTLDIAPVVTKLIL